MSFTNGNKCMSFQLDALFYLFVCLFLYLTNLVGIYSTMVNRWQECIFLPCFLPQENIFSLSSFSMMELCFFTEFFIHAFIRLKMLLFIPLLNIFMYTCIVSLILMMLFLYITSLYISLYVQFISLYIQTLCYAIVFKLYIYKRIFKKQ